MRRSLVAAVALLWLLAAACAQATEFRFATADEGRALLTARDEYIARLGPLERALKAESAGPVSAEAYLAIVGAAVRPWPEDDRAAVEEALAAIRGALAGHRLPLPSRVTLVRSSGAGEGGAAHTRGTTVVLTDDVFRRPAQLPFLLAHELFHVASRHERRWRDAMYATIGFVALEEAVLPEPLAQRRITNPDAPKLDVAVRVEAAGSPVWVMPVLQATVDRYDPARGGEFFATMQLVWLEVGRGDAVPVRPSIGDPPRLLRTPELAGLFEQIGRNTGYVIHPEEILADNFAQIVSGQAPRSPEVHERLRRALVASPAR